MPVGVCWVGPGTARRPGLLSRRRRFSDRRGVARQIRRLEGRSRRGAGVAGRAGATPVYPARARTPPPFRLLRTRGQGRDLDPPAWRLDRTRTPTACRSRRTRQPAGGSATTGWRQALWGKRARPLLARPSQRAAAAADRTQAVYHLPLPQGTPVPAGDRRPGRTRVGAPPLRAQPTQRRSQPATSHPGRCSSLEHPRGHPALSRVGPASRRCRG